MERLFTYRGAHAGNGDIPVGERSAEHNVVVQQLIPRQRAMRPHGHDLCELTLVDADHLARTNVVIVGPVAPLDGGLEPSEWIQTLPHLVAVPRQHFFFARHAVDVRPEDHVLASAMPNLPADAVH